MVPIAQPVIAKNAKRYVLECLRSGWISSKGPYVGQFEKAFADFVGVRQAIAVNSGTAAVHLALSALKIGPKDEVIVPTLTMIAAALPIVYVGATPVLVDSEEDTGNIDVGKIEGKITKRTKAIVAVHLNGHPVDMAPLIRLARSYNVSAIEDAAEAHGAEYQMPNGRWKKVGSIADLGCFSLYANKIVTSGEGGFVTTNDRELAKRVRSLRNLARSPKRHFFHSEVGFTYRMSNLEAAVGLAQLEEVKRFLEKKAKLASVYTSQLRNVADVTLPIEKPYARRIYWNYDVLVSKNTTLRADKLARYLEKHAVETRRFVTPLHRQPAFLRLGLFRGEKYPVAEDLARRGLSLPLGLAMKESEVKRVCKLVKTAI